MEIYDDKVTDGFRCFTDVRANPITGVKADFHGMEPLAAYSAQEYQAYQDKVMAAALRPEAEIQAELDALNKRAEDELSEALLKVRDRYLDYYREAIALSRAASLAAAGVPLENTGNQWVVEETGDRDKEKHLISNEVFAFRISLSTWQHAETFRAPARVTWTVQFNLSSNIRGQDRTFVVKEQTFKDGEKALKYFEGRKAYYQKAYFSDGPRPVIPLAYREYMLCMGFEIPGFRYEH